MSYYCGMRDPPKNRKLGTPEECLRARQVRLYGVNKIDPKLIQEVQGMRKKHRMSELQEAILKLHILQDKNKYLIKQHQKAKLIAETTDKERTRKNAQKRMQKLVKEHEILKKKILEQQNLVRKLQKEEKEKQKEKKEKKKPTGRKDRMSDLQEAIFKLNNLMFDAKYLRRRYDNIKKILDTTTDETERKNAQNELQKIFKERDILIKKINDQKEVVRILQEKEKQQQKS
jgi:hypothetical protein